MSVVVGSVLAPFKLDEHGHAFSWLEHAPLEADQEVRYFAALETDRRGLVAYNDGSEPDMRRWGSGEMATVYGITDDGEPYGLEYLCDVNEERTQALRRGSLLHRLDAIGAQWWSYSIDTGARTWATGGDRHFRVCVGRNAIIDYAMRTGAEWVLFLDADVSPPADLLPRLLELDWPVTAAHVPTYGPGAPDGQPGVRVEAWLNGGRSADDERLRRAGQVGDTLIHWTTAGCILWHREVFQQVRWHWNGFRGQSDDPATQALCFWLGWPTLVRHDVIAQHNPPSIGALETRGHDLQIRR